MRPAALATMLLACGGVLDQPSPPPAAPQTSRATIGESGGTLTHATGARLVVPAGELRALTEMAIESPSPSAPALPAGLVAQSSVFTFTPHGTEFGPGEVSAEGARVRIPLLAGAPSDARMLKAQPGGEWTWYPATRSDGFLEATVYALSYFAAATGCLRQATRDSACSGGAARSFCQGCQTADGSSEGLAYACSASTPQSCAKVTSCRNTQVCPGSCGEDLCLASIADLYCCK